MGKIINLNCIILAAGKGTRMQSKDTHKVCFDINGAPAIIQAMDRYTLAGINDYTIVVGSMAEQVMMTVSTKYPFVKYAYQSSALGTGNAARIGYEVTDKSSNILITMGDKIISPEVINELIKKFENSSLDLLFAVVPKQDNTVGGHIVIDHGIKGNVEDLDLKKAQIYSKLLNRLNETEELDFQLYINEITTNIITSERKREKVLKQMSTIFELINVKSFSEAKKILEQESKIILGNKSYQPAFIDASEYSNAALYMFKPEALEYGLNTINNKNAEGEEYLTDVVNAICINEKYKVDVLKVENENDILTYNNVTELIRIQNILSSEKSNINISFDKYRQIDEWLSMFKERNLNMLNTLQEIYGDDEALITERIETYILVLETFKKKYGTKKVVISRAPGRVNLMGRHVEHRGGCVNVISINKEVICVGAPNNSDSINITNTDNEYSDKSFNIAEHFKDVTWESWLDYLDNDKIIKLVTDSKGDWMNYVKAPILKLQYTFKEQPLLGMDLAFDGNIPVAAGLSSSSAIVVATAEIAVAINCLDIKPQQFVDLCGKGEWFVGSRGGAGDHAAMKFGERGNITSLGFFPFGFRESFPFPEGYKIVIANSFVKANKTTNAKDSFNQRIASYEFGLMMIKEKYPQYEEKLTYLRDINPERLNIKQSEIYEMILSLPEKIKGNELFAFISVKYHNDIKRILKTHVQSEYYYIRPVMMYGIAECRRSFICSNLLKEGDFNGFGELMKISHDGDRVFDSNDNSDYDWTICDEKINRLISDLKSEEFQRVNASQLHKQPGGYACSTKEIDFIVDTVCKVDGVIGAQLSGAGLGGCVMIMVKDEAINQVSSVLLEKYYNPKKLPNGITVCIPVKGSGLLEVV